MNAKGLPSSVNPYPQHLSGDYCWRSRPPVHTSECGCDRKGWEGLPFVELDGQSWPVSFAAGFLGVAEEDLRALVKISGLQPSGVIKMADFRRSGRQPKAYPATGLIRLSEVARSLREEFSGEPADSQSQVV